MWRSVKHMNIKGTVDVVIDLVFSSVFYLPELLVVLWRLWWGVLNLFLSLGMRVW